MAIIKAGLSEVVLDLQRVNRSIANLSVQLAQSKRVPTPASDPISFTEDARLKKAARQLELYNENLSKGAQINRQVNDALKATDQFLSLGISRLNDAKMEVGPVRESSIASYNLVLEQINQIANPSDPILRKVLSDPSIDPDAGPIAIVANDGGLQIMIEPKNITTLPDGLDLQPLDPATATNAQINDAIVALEAAMQKVKQYQNQSAADQLNLERAVDFNVDDRRIAMKISDRIQEIDLNKLVATLRSAEVQQVLATESIRSLTVFQREVYSLLN